MVTRRKMLLELGLGALAVGTGSYFILNDQPMRPAPQREEKVLCDFHAHPSKKNKLEDIINMLGSPGLVGLAAKYIDKSGEDILLYEEAVDIARIKQDRSFAEITPGKLAKYKQGYFVRAQEIKAGIFHVLALGWEGNYFQSHQNFSTVWEAVQGIHAKKGLSIFNHPYFVARGGLLVQFANEDEIQEIREGYEVADAVEVHNAFCINLLPVIAWVRNANRLAEQLAQEYEHKGIAGSDCHRELVQAKIVGNYIDRGIIEKGGIEGIKQAVALGNFERFGSYNTGPYVSRWSWMKGVAGDVISALR